MLFLHDDLGYTLMWVGCPDHYSCCLFTWAYLVGQLLKQVCLNVMMVQPRIETAWFNFRLWQFLEN